jgi:polar amino acid transport system substrate-binding protein
MTMTCRQGTNPKLPNFGLSLLTAGAVHFGIVASARAGDNQSNDPRMAGFRHFGARILRRSATLMLVLVAGLGMPGTIWAQNGPATLRVAAFLVPPAVMKKGDQLTGFSIELWEEIAARLKVKSSYELFPDPDSCVESVRLDKADICVSGVFYTTVRDKVIDYTYPILNAGQRVMVRAQDAGNGGQMRPLRDFLSLLFSQSAVIWLICALIIVLIPAHVIWLLDRRNEDGVIPERNYFPGIFHSMLWAITALVTQVQSLPKNWFARIFGAIWLFAGVVFVSLYTAQLTTLLTVEQIRGNINGPGDLPGKRVGTVHSTSEIYLRNIRADVQVFPSVDEMYQALLDGRVDAVVLGAPVLTYYAQHEGQGRVKLVGAEVEKNDVGFIVHLGSPLRKQVSNQLLELHEDGAYQRIYEKWFGTE